MKVAGIVCLTLVSTSFIVLGDPPPKDLVAASLIADVRTAGVGKPFHVGLLLKIKPGWHVYWENPGDSGSPTRLKVTVPPGVSVGPVQYPLPKTFEQPGDVIGYGYEDQLMLIAAVTVPADWPAEKPVQLLAEASWLSCSDEICIPGKAKLELVVPVGQEAQRANPSEFQKWVSRLPVTEHGDLPFGVDGTARSLRLGWKMPVTNVQVLTVSPQGLEVTQTYVKHEVNTSLISNKLRVIEPEKAAGTKLGLLITYKADGQRRGVRLSVPLGQQK